MKIFLLLLIFISSCFGMDIISFSITDNDTINIYLDIFLTFLVVLVPLFGSISLFGAK